VGYKAETSAPMGVLATILSLSSQTAGEVSAIWAIRNTNGTIRVRITVDAVVVVDETSATIAASDYAYFSTNGKWVDTNQTDETLAAKLIRIPFNDTLLIEATGVGTMKVRHWET